MNGIARPAKILVAVDNINKNDGLLVKKKERLLITRIISICVNSDSINQTV